MDMPTEMGQIDTLSAVGLVILLEIVVVLISLVSIVLVVFCMVSYKKAMMERERLRLIGFKMIEGLDLEEGKARDDETNLSGNETGQLMVNVELAEQSNKEQTGDNEPAAEAIETKQTNELTGVSNEGADVAIVEVQQESGDAETKPKDETCKREIDQKELSNRAEGNTPGEQLTEGSKESGTETGDGKTEKAVTAENPSKKEDVIQDLLFAKVAVTAKPEATKSESRQGEQQGVNETKTEQEVEDVSVQVLLPKAGEKAVTAENPSKREDVIQDLLFSKVLMTVKPKSELKQGEQEGEDDNKRGQKPEDVSVQASLSKAGATETDQATKGPDEGANKGPDEGANRGPEDVNVKESVEETNEKTKAIQHNGDKVIEEDEKKELKK